MSIFYTYLHCKPDGTPFYVGKGQKNRAYDMARRSEWHRRVTAKYGTGGIQVFVFLCESEKQAIQDEIQQIAQLRSAGYDLVNITQGGDGATGYRHTEEHKRRVAERMRGNKYWVGRTLSPAHAQALREANIGNTHGRANKGKKHPENCPCCAQHAATLRGKVLSEATKRKMALSHTGVLRGPMSDAQKQRISATKQAYWAEHKRKKDEFRACRKCGVMFNTYDCRNCASVRDKKKRAERKGPGGTDGTIC